MFAKTRWCHVASNNRDQPKAGIFLYKTKDTKEDLLSDGYFNEIAGDVQLHDIIIAVQYDPNDNSVISTYQLGVIVRTNQTVSIKMTQQEIGFDPTGTNYITADNIDDAIRELDAALKTEEERAIGIEEDLQDQIDDVVGDITDLQTDKEDKANKGVAGGYCELDSNTKVPLDRMPIAALKYKGTWNATTNTPALTDNDPTKAGEVYIVSVAGTQFSIDWQVSDWLVYNDSGIIQKIDNTDLVVSVNGQTGIVTGLEETVNKVSSIPDNTGSETDYPNVKAIEDYLANISGASLLPGFGMLNLYNSLPNAAWVWGDVGKQELGNASTNYANLVDYITGGLIPSGTEAAWDAAYAANPDNAVPFWVYDSVTDKVIVPNIPRGYGFTAAGSLANVGAVVQNAAPNIAGSFQIYTLDATGYARVLNETGCIELDNSGTCVNIDGNNVSAGQDNRVKIDASNSNAAYGRDSTTVVRGDQIQMRVMFYVGAEVSPQTASQITAANVLSELHSKLDKPSTWSNDDFASMRDAIQGVDWTDAQAISVTTSNVAIGYDGLLVGYINAAGATESQLYINNIEVSREAADYAVLQMFVKSTDLIRGSTTSSAFKVIPYNYATGTNNLILGINYYGKFATTGDLDTASASLIETPLGKGRWALVGNDIDGYVRYYTVPTDGSFSEFTWEEGAPDTTDGDYVVESYINGTTWYRLYKSGWVEQGGILSGNSSSVDFPVEMANGDYYWEARSPATSNWYNLNAARNATGFTSCADIYGTAAANASHAYWVTNTVWQVKGMAA